MAHTTQTWTFSQYSKNCQQKSNILRPLQNRKRFYFNKHWKYLENAFLCYCKGSFDNCTVCNLILIPWNSSKLAHGLIFSKEGQKGDFKIVMQMLVNEWISITCFNCFSIVFPSLGKKCLIRLKTCRKIKIRNAWGYKRIGLWIVGIQISKVKNQLELLCTKKN